MTLIDKAEALAILAPAPNAKNGLWAKRKQALYDAVAALPERGVGVKAGLTRREMEVLRAIVHDHYVSEIETNSHSGAEMAKGILGKIKRTLALSPAPDALFATRPLTDEEAAAIRAEVPGRFYPAPTDAPHVNETPKSEHDGADVLTDAQAREAALRSLASFVSGMDESTFFSFANDMDRAFETHRATEASDRILALIGEART